MCPVDARLLAGVRVLCAANAAELGSRSSVELGRWESPLSPRNEVAALRTLAGLCAVLLSQFATDAEGDSAMLRSGLDTGTGHALSSDEQLAVRFRLEKKRLLAAATAALSERLKVLGSAQVADKKGDGTRPAGKGFGR
jgi:hypothetical protein